MIQVVVCVDGDGHFHVTSINDRDKTINAIKQICDGDHLANSLDNLPDDFVKHYKSLSEYDWKESLNTLTQRGLLEIKTLELELK